MFRSFLPDSTDLALQRNATLKKYGKNEDDWGDDIVQNNFLDEIPSCGLLTACTFYHVSQNLLLTFCFCCRQQEILSVV